MDESTTRARASGRSRPLVVATLTLLALGLLQQALILAEALAENPFALVPINDAQTYWGWAGEIARGSLVGRTPFLSAPLYPYFVGLVRALGGGLFGLYALQVALHLATAGLLVRVAFLRWGGGARAGTLALAAGALWLLLDEPAYATARVLGSGLQALLVVLLWERMLAPRAQSTWGAALVGLALGALVLAQPPLLVALPLVVFWAWRGAGGARAAAACATAALLAIAPATLHNRLASGETILVSAQAGVTFRHGNAPGADGTYTPIPGVSGDRMRQNYDARALAGEGGSSWRATSRYWLARGLEFWREEPGAALALAARKLHWFFTGRHYGDVYLPDLEVEGGFARRLALAPVRSAWILLPALVALACAPGGWRKRLPELVLGLVPLAVVVVFWYSPRYRFPALPVAAVFAPLALERVLAWRRSPALALACAAAWVLALASGPLDRALGFDPLEPLRAQYQRQLGRVLVEQARYGEAEAALRRSVELGDADAAIALADLLRRRGEHEAALEQLRTAVAARPSDAFAARSLAVVLAESAQGLRAEEERRARLEEARAAFERALVLDPRDVESLLGLGNVLLGLDDLEGALARYREALELVDCYASAWFNLGLAQERRGAREEALAAWREALRCDPRMNAARFALEGEARARRDWGEAARLLREGVAGAPDDLALANRLAWLLATAPDERVRDGAQALRLAQRVVEQTGGSDPFALDVLAAAQAETGELEAARASAERALGLLRRLHGSQAALAELEAHLAAYREGRPWRP